jgi:arylsulfatase A-like enzyme
MMTVRFLPAHYVLRISGLALTVGLVAGGLFGVREVVAHRHWVYRTYWLAAEQLAGNLVRGIAWGALLAVATIVILVWLGSLARWQRGGGATAPGRSARLQVALSWAALGLSGLTVALWLSLPMLAGWRASGHPPVILISIDTLRADRLGVHGNPRGLTPNLDRIGREGTVFEFATSTAPWTLPSHVSMLTSQLPFDHGVRRAGSSIPHRLSLLSERFRDAGYRTAAFTGGGYVSWGYGFGQGFEVFEDHDERALGGPAAVVRSALDWVQRNRDSPFFLFVHTYEPHHPYAHDEFADPSAAGRLSVGYNSHDRNAIKDLTPAERRYAVGLYDSDVAHTDRVIGGMLEALRDQGVLDRAIVVVTSDHGEDCWDHDAEDIPRHGHTLYEELLHVPLLVRVPGIAPAGWRIGTPVSLLDIGPTLLELAGLPEAEEYAGRSLARSCLEGAEPEGLPIISESTRYGPDRFALRDGDLKVVFTPFPDRVNEEAQLDVVALEVFDLRVDPDERVNIAGEPFVSQELVRTVLRRAADSMGDAGIVVDEGTLDSETIARLRALGYLD